LERNTSLRKLSFALGVDPDGNFDRHQRPAAQRSTIPGELKSVYSVGPRSGNWPGFLFAYSLSKITVNRGYGRGAGRSQWAELRGSFVNFEAFNYELCDRKHDTRHTDFLGACKEVYSTERFVRPKVDVNRNQDDHRISNCHWNSAVRAILQDWSLVDDVHSDIAGTTGVFVPILVKNCFLVQKLGYIIYYHA
jgi:hypothetical protein